MIKVSIVGASGYTGGDLLRILLFHPEVEIHQVTSERHAGKLVSSVHPNLRKICKHKFVAVAELERCDVLFLGLPHGQMMNRLPEFENLADTLIDLSADFRIRDARAFETWYGKPHACADRLGRYAERACFTTKPQEPPRRMRVVQSPEFQALPSDGAPS